MAKRSAEIKVEPAAASLQRIARLLALIAIKGEDEIEKIRTLNAAGFEIAEIGELLGKSANNVSVVLYRMRKSPRARRRVVKG